MMRWFRRGVWFVAVVGWLAVILNLLVTDQPAGLVVASCICAVATLIAIFVTFGWWLGIRRMVRKHLRFHPRDGALLEHRLTSRDRTDVLRAMHELTVSSHGRLEGMAFGHSNLQDQIIGNPEPLKIEWESVQTDVAEWEEVAANAVFFLTYDGIPFVAAIVRQITNRYGGYDVEEELEQVNYGPPHLHILAQDREQCRQSRDYLLSMAQQHNVYLGRKILVRPGDRKGELVTVEFSAIAPVLRENIVLPQHIFDVVDRAGIKQMDLSDVLQKAGHRTRTAILLHGPPGTGKTLLTRHLVSTRKDATTIMLHGFRRGLVREAFQLARYCQPSIVVIEDVDLIAVRRTRSSRGTSLLHELLDELDGLALESRTLVIMTTNRPDVLEPALASRPGRVSQAVEVPLPDDECRRQILELFTAKIDATNVETADWVQRTAGASPAFLEELVRRAILFATERIDQDQLATARIAITNDDLVSAMHEIISSGGALTQKLLGYADA